MSDIQNFQEEKKSHWQSYESERNEKKKAELQNREFYTPSESLFSKLKTENFDRKTFLKFMGASVAMSTLNCVRKPVEKIIPYVNAPQEIKHGHSLYYASTCKACSAGCGTLVRTKDGRPLKLEGNPEHPLNKGGLCASGQASIFDLYDPDRSREPIRVKDGKGHTTDWKMLDASVKKSLQDNPGKTVILTSPIASPSTLEIINSFLSSVGGGTHYQYQATGPEEAIALANGKSYGKAVVPNYRFDRAKAIVSIDADFLGTWISPVEFTKQFSNRRKIQSDTQEINTFIAIESVPTVTGSNAEFRIAIKPGDQRRAVFALALALKELGANIPGTITSYDLDTLCKESGINKESIQKAAKALWLNKGASLVVAGGVSSQTSDAVDLQISVNLLNSILGSNGNTIDYSGYRSDVAGKYSKNLNQLKEDLKAKKVGTLILAGVNPVFHNPGEDWKALFSNANSVVSVTDRLDETGMISNWIANVSHFLENWGDSEPVKGIVSLQQPMVQPLFDSRSLEDSLIQWAGGELKGSKSFYEFFRSKYISKLGNEKNLQKAIQAGILPGSSLGGGGGAGGFSNSSLRSLDPQTKGTTLSLYTNVGIGDGSLANNSLRQELPDPVSKVTWDNYLAISPGLALSLKVESNDVVKATVNGKSVELPVQIQPGMHMDAVGLAIGYGRTSTGKVGDNVGYNSLNLAKNSDGLPEYSGLSVQLEKTGKKYKLATTQDHHMMNPTTVPGKKSPGGLFKPYDKDRPLIQSTTFTEWKKNPGSGVAEPEIPKILDGKGNKVNSRGLNPEFPYNGHKWGMSVDLTLCTGCAACVIACQVENNIPSVGRDEVRVGREMHWIRIDRYYIGDPEKPETMEIAHQPVMCQHCDNAPCETVCPVIATMHGSEGTNDMIYNRCVGTRYCSNNCPYKVRRFNWMNHYNGTDASRAPRYLGFNPDVTVRSRGVMEKCTFCAGRVAEKKIKAKNEGRTILNDGEVKTACQETCPSDAITFGNTNDENSSVSKNRKDKRGYQILEYLNVKPQVTYLSRVRNTI